MSPPRVIDNSFEIGDFSHSEKEDRGFESGAVSNNDFNIGDFETNKMKGHYFGENFGENLEENPIENTSTENNASQDDFSQGELSDGSQSTLGSHSLNSAVNSMPSQANKTYSEAEYNELQQHNKQLQEQVAELTRQLQMSTQQTPTSPSNNTVNGSELNNVVEAMGLSKWNLDANKINQINQTVGLLMRETMLGMMQVLKFRKKIKEEFRINVTTIQSVENNPLKFSANIDDAMENMFIKENNAYKSPIDAVKEGFESIAEHQVAVVAGMQAAFRGMIERFDPQHLESRFEKYNSSSFLSLGQKTKRWNDYKAYHKELTENLDDSFQHLFGYDFVQAYEEQMQQLISARISKS